MSNKYTYSAPYSEKELFDLYVTKGMTQTEIGNLFGISQHKVWRDCKRMGIGSRVAAKRNQKGEHNDSWKGGKILVNYKTPIGHRFMSDRNQTKGYYMVRLPEHPNAGKNGYVFEHIVIALESANCPKLDNKTECVHHINFIRTDNRPENLVICSKDKHREIHGKLENLTGQLLDSGVVGFSINDGYFVK